MAFSRVVLNYAGSNTFAVNFTLGYISPDHVTARVNDEVDGSQQPVYRTLTWLTEGTVTVNGSLEDGDVVTFERTTPKDELTNVYLDGDILDDENIDDSFRQAIMIAHEVLDGRLGVLGDNIDMGTNRITNMGDPVDAQDVATKNYIDTFEALNTVTIIAARDKSEQWAEEDEDIEVETGQYSSKHHALKSAASAAASATSETNAAASALAASSALESSFMSDSITLTSADSPFTLTTTHVGNFVGVDTSGGDVIINIDPNLIEPYSVRIKKGTSDQNIVTVNTQATETFSDAATTKTITSVGGLDLTLNTDTSPDTWDFARFGAAAGEPKKQLFTAPGDYTKGVTTLTLTNTPVAPSSTALTVSYDGMIQHSDQWSYEPSTGVFTDSAGITADSVQFAWEASSLAIGVTGDGTVSYNKLASGLIANATETIAKTPNKLVEAANLGTQILGVSFNSVDTGLSTTANIPSDNTVPQITEGTEFLSLTHNVVSANSDLYIEVVALVGAGAVSNTAAVALFESGVNEAIACNACRIAGNGSSQILKILAKVPSNGTGDRTFVLRFGASSGTMYINRLAGADDLYGSAGYSCIKITEVE